MYYFEFFDTRWLLKQFFFLQNYNYICKIMIQQLYEKLANNFKNLFNLNLKFSLHYLNFLKIEIFGDFN